MPATETDVSIRTPRGGTLAATLRLPPGPGPHCGVLLCQGLSGVRNLVLPHVAARLGDAGFATLRFDYTGHGESTGPRGWINPADRIGDAVAALAYLVGRPEVTPDRIGVYGHSYGGPTAIGVAATDQRVRAVAAVSGPGNGVDLLRAARPSWEWLEFCGRVDAELVAVAGGADPTVVGVDEILPFSPAFRKAYDELKRKQGGSSAMVAGTTLGSTEFYLATVPEMLRSHPESDAGRLAHAPLLLVNGAADDTVPLAIVAPVYQAAPGPKRWHVVPDADHNTLDTAAGLGPALDDVADWFRYYV